MKILWSERALRDLDEIFEFYQLIGSFEVAQKVVGRLIDKADILVNYPEMGNVEVFENAQPFEYRFLIEGHHKLIYRVSAESSLMFIARVVDIRRSPKKKNP